MTTTSGEKQMSKRSLGLWLTLAVVFWLWMDFVGLFLSVASTYFYFGWEGTPNLTLIIFGIALLCFSGPTWARVLFFRNRSPLLLPGLTAALLFIYLFVTFVRSSHLFAWATVAGALLGGLTAVIALRETRLQSGWFEPVLGVMTGYILSSLSRVINVGLATLFVVKWPAIALLIAMSALALYFLMTSDETSPEEPESRTEAAGTLLTQVQAISAGLLVGLSVGLMFNLNVWNRAFGLKELSTTVFLLALGAAMTTGIGLLAAAGQNRFTTVLLLVLSALFIGLGLKMVLDMPTSRGAAVLVFFLSSVGLTIFWGVFLRRLHLFLQQNDGRLPYLGLQIGFVLFLFVLLFFLLFSNPNGFWVALGLSTTLLLLLELTHEDVKLGARVAPRYGVAVAVLFVAPAILSMTGGGVSQKKVKPLSQSPRFTVMTANIRYGWTDDYRYEPGPMLNWLKKHPADLIGFQEFNRGHTSASYMDLFTFYTASLPGNWHYADANYGFGNALLSRFPVKSAKLMNYDAKDILRRSCLKTVVEVHGQKINVMVTHLSHIAHPNKIRQAQVQQLIKWLKKNKRPWILMGDMNAKPKHPEIKWLTAAAHPLFTKRSKELFTPKSYPAKKPNIRIDYIFFSKHFKLHSMKVLDPGIATDHRPIRAVLSLKKRKDAAPVPAKNRKPAPSR
jgi:endonuclease/exonuclease/phosphatase family metal-dependent hydrolase